MICKGKAFIHASQLKLILGLPDSAEIVGVDADGEGSIEIKYVTIGEVEGKSSKNRDFNNMRRKSIGLAVHEDGRVEIN